VYIVHLPVVAGLQVALAGTGLPWWIQIPLITAVTLIVTLLSYRELVRDTWVGRWLNGSTARN
jgi:glucan biosynthesis protein C